MLGKPACIEDRALRPFDGLIRVAKPVPRVGVAKRVVRDQGRAMPALRRDAGEEHLRPPRPETARNALDQERAGRVDHGDAAKVEDDDIGDTG